MVENENDFVRSSLEEFVPCFLAEDAKGVRDVG